MYEVLFQPMKIGGMSLKNRIAMAPMATVADPDGGFSQVVSDYFTARAKGGAGLIMSGALAVTDRYGTPASGWIGSPMHTARLTQLADRIHIYGAKFCLELTYGNGRCGCSDPSKPPFSASAVPTLQYPDVLCREMPKEDIHFLVQQAGKAAAQAKLAGVDGVVIHAYAGYLLDQFQSSEWNHRTDEYGGSLENRMRFTAETIDAVRKACGPQFAIIVKFSVEHHAEGGRELPEGLKMCQMLEKLGADAIMVDGGSFPTQWNRCIPTVYEHAGFSIDLARQVREKVSIPVIGQNKMNDPACSAAAVEKGWCDLVALGHGLLADPEWVNKVHNGHSDTIRPCIGCNECFLAICSGQNFRCTVNPYVSHEEDPHFQVPKAEHPGKVLVIGGGPAGISAAVLSAQAGHQVELWEKSQELGGNLNAAGAPSFKKDLMSYRDYLLRCLEISGVTVCLGQEATVERVKESGAEQVIYAAGATARILNVPGVDQPHVKTALEVLHRRERPSGHVVVIGGGLVGCETALMAAESAQRVTVLEYMPSLPLFRTEARNNQLALRQMLADRNVEIQCGVQTQSIGADTITYQQAGQTKTRLADTVILSVGFQSRQQLAQELDQAGIKIRIIGDAQAPRKIMHAVHEGLSAAIGLST